MGKRCHIHPDQSGDTSKRALQGRGRIFRCHSHLSGAYFFKASFDAGDIRLWTSTPQSQRVLTPAHNPAFYG
ncbi:hypothetical protein SAMN05443144_107179 [Fodinibius roseus]|uniref:Uncharacterized protein n=1 Tax=Fodinibius roseus TaxID=1194090 RepID=A0A1M5AUP5_9BACT|nr:hypothetical protein SAMN05443144_107179 [Fodinibius roseus]